MQGSCCGSVKDRKTIGGCSFDDILELLMVSWLRVAILGVELPVQNVPPIQKRLGAQVSCGGKPVIVATQMLESMIESPMPHAGRSV